MPVIPSNYRPPWPFRNGHFSTIYASGLRRVSGVRHQRTQLPTGDKDFLELDWSYALKPSDSLAVILHGLEGDAQRPYMLGSAKAFNQSGMDALCVNLRGCGGQPNKLYSSYHSGKSEDLSAVIHYILEHTQYNQIVLNGFSLGANIMLKYLGEGAIPDPIKAAVAVSVPCDLYGTMLELHKSKNWIYAKRFKKNLLEKLRQKQRLFPEKINVNTINQIKTLKDFDDIYTSKAHGFTDAVDYYKKSSSLQYLPNISTPTLLLNALNDSFLAPSCFPVNIAKENHNLYLETPKYGGHVGFYMAGNTYYNEQRAVEFIRSNSIVT